MNPVLQKVLLAMLIVSTSIKTATIFLQRRNVSFSDGPIFNDLKCFKKVNGHTLNWKNYNSQFFKMQFYPKVQTASLAAFRKSQTYQMGILKRGKRKELMVPTGAWRALLCRYFLCVLWWDRCYQIAKRITYMMLQLLLHYHIFCVFYFLGSLL